MPPQEKLPVLVSELPDLHSLPEMPRPELLNWYQMLHKRAAPKQMGRKLLIGTVSWAIQAIHMGREPMALRQELIKKLDAKFGGNRSDPRKRYKPGTRLIREWQGVVYEVMITDQGYVWRGNTYTSLSKIASEITGTHWSGPRFFGIPKPSINGRKRQRLEKIKTRIQGCLNASSSQGSITK